MFGGKGCAPGEATTAEADASSAEGQRQSVRIALCDAGAHRDIALKAVREARADIADDDSMSAEVRAKVLEQLDRSIARMEQEAR